MNLGGDRKAINSLQLLCRLSCYYYNITGLTDYLQRITCPDLCLSYQLHFAVSIFLRIPPAFHTFQ